MLKLCACHGAPQGDGCVCMGVGGLTIVVREADAQVDLLDLLQEEILLIKEKHDGGCSKEPVVADAVEEMERLVHAVLRTL